MSNGWSAGFYTLTPNPVVGASQTNVVVSKQYPVTAGGSIHHVVAIDATTVTSTTGITAKLQTAIGSTWVDSKTVAITAAGRFYIKLNVEVTADQTYLPLLNSGRIVITTGTGDAVTITGVNVLQEL